MSILAASNIAPVAIGGLGGSGTRLIAQTVDQLGLHIGDHLNRQSDNLFFTLLFKRPSWFETFPDDDEIQHAIEIFAAAMTTGLKDALSTPDKKLIKQLGATIRRSRSSIGVEPATAKRLIASPKPDLANRIGWGWKEPNTHIFIPQIAMHFPGMKYIHVIRHGLDMALSRNQQQARNWGRHICGHDFNAGEMSPRLCLDYWITANRRAISLARDRFGENFLLVNYDQFCADPEAGVPALAEFLGVDIGSEQKTDLLSLIRPTSIGRHEALARGVFSEDQINAVRELGFQVE